MGFMESEECHFTEKSHTCDDTIQEINPDPYPNTYIAVVILSISTATTKRSFNNNCKTSIAPISVKIFKEQPKVVSGTSNRAISKLSDHKGFLFQNHRGFLLVVGLSQC